MIESHRIDIRGIATPMLHAGPANSETAVVFVHGNPGSGRDWETLVGEVGGFARAVALDMPGFGQADKPRVFNYTVEGYAEHLAAALEQLGIRRAHLVLHDFGGPWGLTWAATHPQAFASATLINTGYLPDYRWHYLARIWRTPLLGELFQAMATRPAFHQLLRHGNPLGLPPAFVDRMYDDYDTRTRHAVLKLYRATGDVSARSAALAAVLMPLRRPAVVVWGRRDPYLPIGYAERQREVFPNAEVHVLDDSGHWPFADNPAAVSAAVLPFLRRQCSAAPTTENPL